MYLSLIEHVDLNRKANPCNKDLNYDFQLCVKNSVTRKLGCRFPWDLWSSTYFPRCTESEKIGKYHHLYLEIALTDLDTIIKDTGCIKPCRYREYTLLTEGIDYGTDYVGIYLQLANSNKEIVEMEMEFYSFVSLLSDDNMTNYCWLCLVFLMTPNASPRPLHVAGMSSCPIYCYANVNVNQ